MRLCWCLLLLLVSELHCKLPLEDAQAYIGQLFTYQINSTEFNREIKIHEVNSKSLPEWLHYDPSTHLLQGVPLVNDTGATVITVNDELFAVSVLPDSTSKIVQPQNNNEEEECSKKDIIYSVYVTLVGKDVQQMPGNERVRVIRSASEHLNMKPQYIRLTKHKSDLTALPEKALLSEIGNAKSKQIGTEAMALSWIVGCNSVKQSMIDSLEKLQQTAKDGSMAHAIGFDVSHWQVVQARKKRQLRNPLITATPIPTTATQLPDSATRKSTIQSVQPTVTPETPTIRPVPVMLSFDGIPEYFIARTGEIFTWNLPNELFNYPLDELTFRLMTNNPENWLVIRENGKPQLIGIQEPNRGELVELFLKVEHGVGGVMEVPIKIRVNTPIHSLQMSYIVKLAGGEEVSALALARTLEVMGETENVRIEQIRRRSNRAVVTFGESMGSDSYCRASNIRILRNLQALEGVETSVVGSLYYESVMITDVVQSRPHYPCEDSAPTLNTAIYDQYRIIEVMSGELYNDVINPKLFLDDTDGDLSNMKVYLLVDGLTEAKDGWISLGENTRQLQALTWDAPVNSREQYTLVAIDSHGNKAESTIDVKIVQNNRVPETHELTMVLEESYSNFANDHALQLSMYQKLSSLFPGSTLTIESVQDGSVIINFHVWDQDILDSKYQCPEQQIRSIIDKLFTSKQELSSSLINTMKGFTIEELTFEPLGLCQGAFNNLKAEKTITKETTESEKDSNMTIIIAVAAGLLVVLLIAVILIVVCIRRRKKEKNDREANGTCIQARVPVVLPEEDSFNDSGHPLVASREMMPQTPKPPDYGHHSYPTPSPTCSERS